MTPFHPDPVSVLSDALQSVFARLVVFGATVFLRMGRGRISQPDCLAGLPWGDADVVVASGSNHRNRNTNSRRINPRGLLALLVNFIAWSIFAAMLAVAIANA